MPAAVAGGVTIVQLRDKELDAKDELEILAAMRERLAGLVPADAAADLAAVVLGLARGK